MSYINTNKAINALQDIVIKDFNHKLDYMPDEFNAQQKQAIELFKKRIFLEQIIDEATSFNKKIDFEQSHKNLFLTKTAEDLVDVFKLRSDVYNSIGYGDAFSDEIEGLNFDTYDYNSAILYYKKENQITGTTRLIFDSNNNLPSENEMSFNDFRNNHNHIGEVSRLMIHNEKQGNGNEFKYLTSGIYQIYLKTDIDFIVCGIKQDHYRLYSKFGGFNIEKEINGYGDLDVSALILSWDPSKISNFFKKAFLN